MFIYIEICIKTCFSKNRQMNDTRLFFFPQFIVVKYFQIKRQLKETLHTKTSSPSSRQQKPDEELPASFKKIKTRLLWSSRRRDSSSGRDKVHKVRLRDAPEDSSAVSERQQQETSRQLTLLPLIIYLYSRLLIVSSIKPDVTSQPSKIHKEKHVYVEKSLNNSDF